ncbi:hypothetical protein [Phaffia rhodozyma]|uniref:Uncharacterized protein n=1 Tax=Phaffia rhodozyma TaxID=264483 RepID=A0A0F7SQT0_PHARH|nr:hypothetical protein [Phaffia rhodozyma]
MGYFSSFVKGHPSVETIGSSIDHPDHDRKSKRMSIRSIKHTPRLSVMNELNPQFNTIGRPSDLFIKGSEVSIALANPSCNPTAVDSRLLSTEPPEKGLISKIKFGLGSRPVAMYSQTMPSIYQRKSHTSVYQPSESIRRASHRELDRDQKEDVDTMASRLNQLAMANSNSLLGDEDYRLLRQILFDECASRQSSSLSNSSNRTTEPARGSVQSVRGMPLDWKPAPISYHERALSLSSRYTRYSSRPSFSAQYSSMGLPKVSSSEAGSPEEILSMIRSAESESSHMVEMFDQMERKVLTEAVENGWIVDQNSKNQTESTSVAGSKLESNPLVSNTSDRMIQIKLSDIRERRRDVQYRYDLRLDLFRKKLRAYVP